MVWVLQPPNGPCMIVRMNPDSRRPGETLLDWRERMLAWHLEASPAWATYPRALVSASSLDLEDRSRRNRWRLVKKRIVIAEEDA